MISDVASLAMNNSDEELDKATAQLSAIGIQIFTKVDGKPHEAYEFQLARKSSTPR